MDPTVWPDGTRPAKICTPPSFMGNAPAQAHGVPTPKNIIYICKYKKLAVKIAESYIKNILFTNKVQLHSVLTSKNTFANVKKIC